MKNKKELIKRKNDEQELKAIVRKSYDNALIEKDYIKAEQIREILEAFEKGEK
ncbi:hypothetical protein [Hydrogenophaga sp.]|uniref:hypothetical protein n=1 Tax=Hydrogenophaga sp. TaxID=1904254 RepID=UPI0035B1B548